MLIRLVLALATVLLIATGAPASVAEEERHGAVLVRQLQSGDKRCQDLEAADFERIGEYVMARMVGSTAAHEAMNARMRQALGARAEERMHELIGRRYPSCAGGREADSWMGPVTIGDGGGRGPMMDSEDWNWMAPGAWRGMDRRDWQQVQDRWMGPEMMSTDDGWSVWQIAAAVGGIGLIPLLAAGLLVVLLRRTTSTPAQP